MPKTHQTNSQSRHSRSLPHELKRQFFDGRIWTSQWALCVLYGHSLRKSYTSDLRGNFMLVATIHHIMIIVLRFLTKVYLNQGIKWCMKHSEFSRDLKYLEVWPCVTHIILNISWGNAHLFILFLIPRNKKHKSISQSPQSSHVNKTGCFHHQSLLSCSVRTVKILAIF